MTRQFSAFWAKHPALLFGLSAYFGFVLGFGEKSALLPALLLFMTLSLKRVAAPLFILGCAFAFTHLYYLHPPEVKMEGIAEISITQLQKMRTSFNTDLFQIKGTIHRFMQDRVVAKNIPFTANMSREPPTGHKFIVKGTLIQMSPTHYLLKIKNGERFQPFTKEWSLLPLRMRAKNWVREKIVTYCPHEEAAKFLSSLATGVNEDPHLMTELGRFGVQHILAISGFHFSFFALLISLLLRPLFSPKRSSLLVVLFLTLYLLFLGGSPSIVRAFIASSIFFLQCSFEKKAIGLNSLGVALFLSLLYDPTWALQMGFQFSFLITGAILIFYPLCRGLLDKLQPARPLSQLLQMDSINQQGYILFVWIKEAVALSLAVEIVATPLILFLSQKYPVLSLFYNLFFPFFVTGSLFLLFFGFFLHPLLLTLNSGYTQFLLRLIYDIPRDLELWIHVPPFPVELLSLYLTAIFGAGIYYLSKREEPERLAFL